MRVMGRDSPEDQTAEVTGLGSELNGEELMGRGRWR